MAAPLKLCPTGQTSRKRKPVRKKQNTKNHIQCLECFRDYSAYAPFTGSDLCFNPQLDAERSLDEMLVTCPKESTICQVDIHRVNGYFVALERKCAPACHCICKNTGYGLEREICSRCTRPVDYVHFDNETAPEATCTFVRGQAMSDMKQARLYHVSLLLWLLSYVWCRIAFPLSGLDV
ncbi:hypothetical protein HDE_06125 [Halotydeus destructor]|nr:hypothetical protein HDE_06125 [Halotydeus destructor]